MTKQFIGQFLLIVDYNLSRVKDVAAMRRYAEERYGLRTVLIRPQPQPIDSEISDVVIDLNPRARGFVECAITALSSLSDRIMAGLVFSDNAVYQGAMLLEALGLPVDSGQLALGALNKEAYRCMEQQHAALLEPQGMMLPESCRVNRLDDLTAFSDRHPYGFVIKPSCEGNNRGVIALRRGDDVRQALAEVANYLDDGIICEQLIPYRREFSYDGVGSLSFITEKVSAEGRYPVETGQLLPATLNAEEARTLRRVGGLASLLVGQRNGPFHNEIKLSDDGCSAAVVEPNRRPAGMKIWSLAAKVYGLDLYRLWVDQALGQLVPSELPSRLGQAAVIMLGVPFDGTLAQAPLLCGDRFFRHNVLPALREETVIPDSGLEWFAFTWLQDKNTEARAIPRDNSDFIAQVCVFTPQRDLDLRTFVEQVQYCWRQAIAPHMYSVNDSNIKPKKFAIA